MLQQKICQAAKQRNKEKLRELCEFNSIDAWKERSYYYSATTELAVTNDYDSVEFLLAHGANPSYAAYGAALANNHGYVKNLLSRGADISYAAMGYAEAGKPDTAYPFLQLGADVSKVALAAAKGLGAEDINPNMTEKLLAFIEMLRTEMKASDEDVLFGAVLGGNEAYVASIHNQIQQAQNSHSLKAWDRENTVLKALALKGELNHLTSQPDLNLPEQIQWGPLTINTNGCSAELVAIGLAMGLNSSTNNFLPNQEPLSWLHLACYQGWMVAGHFNKVKALALGDENNDVNSLQGSLNFNGLEPCLLEGGHFATFTRIFGEKYESKQAHTTNRLTYGDLQEINSYFPEFGQEMGGKIPRPHESCGYLITDLSMGFGKIKARNPERFRKRLLFILPFIDIKYFPEMLVALEYKYCQEAISQERAVSMQKIVTTMQHGGVTPIQATVLTDPQLQGALLILTAMALTLPCSFNKLVPDTQFLVMQYLCPIELSPNELTHLGFITAKQYISAQTTTHAKKHPASNLLGSRTSSFNQRIQAATIAEEMKAVISEENQSLAEGSSSSFFQLLESKASVNAHTRTVNAWTPASR
jgi:hypothetical protein